MNIQMIVTPLIGAAIGYLTNEIAVKMLFRPLKPIKIAGHTLPLTPGIIPRSKDRIAKSVAISVSDSLLTADMIKEQLLSDDMKKIVENKFRDLEKRIIEKNPTINEECSKYIEEDKYDKLKILAADKLTNRVISKINNVNVGQLISKEIISAVKQKLNGGFLSMFVKDDFIENIASEVENQINDYIDRNTQSIINPMIIEEINNIEEKKVGDIIEKLLYRDIDLINIFMDIYERLIDEKTDDMVRALNISKIIEEKIIDMDILELEELIIAVMHKELRAIVNLGALIGFILGLLNIIVI